MNFFESKEIFSELSYNEMLTIKGGSLVFGPGDQSSDESEEAQPDILTD